MNAASICQELRVHRGERRRLFVEIALKARDCTTRREARNKMAAELEYAQENMSTKFGVIEIIAIAQLLMALWKFIKDMGWFESTPEFVLERLGC